MHAAIRLEGRPERSRFLEAGIRANALILQEFEPFKGTVTSSPPEAPYQ